MKLYVINKIHHFLLGKFKQYLLHKTFPTKQTTFHFNSLSWTTHSQTTPLVADIEYHSLGNSSDHLSVFINRNPSRSFHQAFLSVQGRSQQELPWWVTWDDQIIIKRIKVLKGKKPGQENNCKSHVKYYFRTLH